MGTHKTTKGASSSSPNVPAIDSTIKRHTKRRKQTSTDNIPGVQKIKAALRQTRRLLAKVQSILEPLGRTLINDNLAADVRITTERRFKSLEGDLAKAELARTERAMASRYHKVKFFERQKVLRKITRIKRMLEGGIDAEGLKLSKKQRKALETELLERRVDLNYILHYPKANKYISLFPPKASAGEGDEDSDAEDVEPPRSDLQSNEGAGVTDKKRQELRTSIRAAMDSGQITLHPEIELPKRGESGRSMPVTSIQQLESSESPTKPERTPNKKTAKSKHKPAPDLNHDSFFEMNMD